MSDSEPGTEQSEAPLQTNPHVPVSPKTTVTPDDIEQPRRVEWGHLSQIRGRVRDDRVRVVRQKRMHRFGHGMHDHGPARPLFVGSLCDALDLYCALDALFTGGAEEVDR